MNNDFVLFGGILLFFFVLWIYTGGPTQPISFAGPYLTPITDVGQESVGYGPSANTYLHSEVISGNYHGGSVSNVAANARSPYAGDVTLSIGNVQTSDERSEYLIIRAHDDDDVTITGWRLVSANSGREYRIPDGKRRNSGSERSIRLTDDDNEAVIVTGSRANDDLKNRYDDDWYAYLDKSDDIWDRDDDTITLLDQNGKVVDQYEY